MLQLKIINQSKVVMKELQNCKDNLCQRHSEIKGVPLLSIHFLSWTINLKNIINHVMHQGSFLCFSQRIKHFFTFSAADNQPGLL